MSSKSRPTIEPSHGRTVAQSNTLQASTRGPGNNALQSMLSVLNGPDIQREGSLTNPQDSTQSTTIDQILQQHSGSGLSEAVMQHAFHPQSGAAEPDRGMRIFVPGLNTPEPEASRRTQVYADVLQESMVHMHNGTHLESEVPYADQIDYAVALMTRMGVKSSPLIDELTKLLSANFQQEVPEDVHLLLYSDSTIAGTQAISKLRKGEIARRMAALAPSKRRSSRQQITEKVDALMRKHLFVELHGNAVADLPMGPQYLLWTDTEDPLSRKELPWSENTLGLHANNKDDNPDAVYVDYDGPYKAYDAHNLAAGGVHVVKETLRLNGVASSQELYEKARQGEKILVPRSVQGNPSELWNPNNQ